MRSRIARTNHIAERGQILVIAVLMMLALIAIAGLAIDVSGAFLEQRWERSVADSAALAGAQDLQKPDRQLPTPDDRVRARRHAMDMLVRQLNATSTPSTDVTSTCLRVPGCSLPGTPYTVSIHAGVEATLPIPTCVSDCDSRRAVQVNVSRCTVQGAACVPNFQLTFSRIFPAFRTWNVSTASVAGIVHARQVGVVTLRPPKPRSNGTDANEKDLVIDGNNTKVIVGDADVITNTNVLCSGTNAELDLEDDLGFAVYYYDPYRQWDGSTGTSSGLCLNPPPGVPITSAVDDPGYTYPSRPADPAHIYNKGPNSDPDAQAKGTDPAHAGYDPNYATRCATEQGTVPPAYRELKTNRRVNDSAQVTTVCLRPGVYNYKLDVKDPSSGNPNVFLLETGVYFFDYGANIDSTLIGGYLGGSPGVAVVLGESNTPNGSPGQFITSSTTSTLALNFGDKYCPVPATDPCPTGASWASPAVGISGPVQTLDASGTAIPITVLVQHDPGCTVVDYDPTACDENQNQTLKLTGGGNIFLAGVQYAPTDNVVLKGNASQGAEVGAMWSWTLQFTGGTVYKIQASNPQMIGNLRLVRACSPTEPCNP
jgi:putative Flp pilus-assembly TadE/G-like protein